MVRIPAWSTVFAPIKKIDLGYSPGVIFTQDFISDYSDA